jgi:hypothetical protein
LIAWGNDFLETLLAHYGVDNGNGPWVDPMNCREEIIPFKRIVDKNKLSNQPPPHQHTRTMDVFPKIFSGRNSHNKEQFKGG